MIFSFFIVFYQRNNCGCHFSLDRWVAAQSIFYHLYNQVSYMSLDEISPLTFSIGNTMKRISVIVSSIIIFRTPVQPINALGAAIAILGTFLYSQVITCALYILSMVVYTSLMAVCFKRALCPYDLFWVQRIWLSLEMLTIFALLNSFTSFVCTSKMLTERILG